MNTIDFFRESIRNLKTIGTFTQSSPALCKGMIKPVDFEQARTIVELGAGDGVITKHILEQLRPDARLLAFEVNPVFCEQMRTNIQDDRLIVVEDSAENLPQYLEKMGLKEVDYVISAIPFVTLPKDLGYRIVSVCADHLKKGGLFIQVHYSLLIKNMYETVFGNVDINFVALNVPPAFVLVSEKQ